MAPWLFRMRWLDLLFAHWSLPAGELVPLVPDGLDLDTWEGRGWVGVVPFTMADVAPRGVPAIPRFSRFPEINVRTYVTRRGVPGILFLSLDARSRPTVEGARRVFHLPYYRARMSSTRVDGSVRYRSRRVDRRGHPAAFAATYRPVGPVEVAPPGSLEAFLTDRLTLFAVAPDGGIRRTRIAHAPWPLQPAEADIAVETLTTAAGIVRPDTPPHLRFAARLDVRAWPPERA